jgi:hypothetical protein
MALLTPPIDKEPGEKIPVTVDFTRDLATGETVTGCVTSAKRVADGVVTSGAVLSGAVSIASPNVTQHVFAGTDGDVHLVQYAATTSLANAYEHSVEVRIRAV